MLHYITNAGGVENTQWLYGNEADTFRLREVVGGIALAIYVGEFVVFDQFVDPGNYPFEVPIVEESSPADFPDEGEVPFWRFSGTINPRVGENFVSFTIYPGDNFSMTLSAECEDQSEGMAHQAGADDGDLCHVSRSVT